MAGNAVTTLVIQRIKLNKQDDKVLKKVRHEDRREAIRQKIRELPESDEQEFRRVVGWFSTGSTEQQLPYLALLYEMLLTEKMTLGQIADARAGWELALKTHATMGVGKGPKGKEREKETEKETERRPAPAKGVGVGAPGGFRPNLGEIGQVKSGLRRQFGGFDQFPAAEKGFLTQIFQTYVTTGFADWSDLYENYYKRSDAKASTQQPSGDDYVRQVRAEDQRRGGQGLGPLPRDIPAREDEATAIKQARSGYPFSTQQGSIGCRVYLNVLTRHAPQVFGEVHELPEVTWAKLGSHEVVSRSRDSIVLYTKDKPSAVELCKRIAAYQSEPGLPRGTKASYFENEIVHFTEPAPGTVGVGIGEDLSPGELGKAAGAYYATPESDKFIEGRRPARDPINYSFSELRTMLIYQALTRSGKNARQFQTELANNFHAAEIDPAQPWQSGRASVKLISLLKELIWVPASTEET